jgi:hypothetical protein
MAKGNGIESKGKTQTKNFGNGGSSAAIQKGKKGPGGKTNEAMLENGRNRDKLINQFGSTGLKGKGR